MTELIIVGNGFDLHHGLQTSYGAFAEYAKTHSHGVYTILSNLFLASSAYMGIDPPPEVDEYNFTYDRWCDFENCIGLLDDQEFVRLSQEDISEYMEELGMGEYLVTNFIDDVASILDTFREWVANIALPPCQKRGFTFDNTTTFINFNYTETLEKFYDVDSDRIFHIHGKRATKDKLIVGHGTSPSKPQSKDDLYLNYDPYNIFLGRTQKPVEAIEPKLRAWLDNLPEIDRISIRGHSLGLVDLQYFQTISQMFPSATWSFSYFNNSDLNNISELIKILNLEDTAISSVATLSEFENDPTVQSNALNGQRSFENGLRNIEGQ